MCVLRCTKLALTHSHIEFSKGQESKRRERLSISTGGHVSVLLWCAVSCNGILNCCVAVLHQ